MGHTTASPAMVTSGRWLGSERTTLTGTSMAFNYSSGKERNGSTGLFVDLDGYAAGTYAVSFNADWAVLNQGNAYYFAYSFTNLTDGAGGVALDCAGKSKSTTFAQQNTVGSTWTEEQIATEITAANGSYNYTFMLSDAGSAGDAIVLGWNVLASADDDNENGGLLTLSEVTITPVPEAATLGMLGLGFMGLLIFRRFSRKA